MSLSAAVNPDKATLWTRDSANREAFSVFKIKVTSSKNVQKTSSCSEEEGPELPGVSPLCPNKTFTGGPYFQCLLKGIN